MFESLMGHEPIKAYLSKAFGERRFPHALLFSGMEGIGKTKCAKELSAHFLDTSLERIEGKTHPDFHALRPEGKSGLHSIESIRSLIEETHRAPFEASGARVFLIEEADRMQPAAANALLKTLEEPTPGTTLLLLTSQPSEILPTILSRCMKLFFQPLAEEEVAMILRQKGFSEDLYGIAKRSFGSAGRALELAKGCPWEEHLLHLLKHGLYPARGISPLQWMGELEKIEVLVEDEDPVKKNRNVEALLASLLMWVRDQWAAFLGIEQKRLFFEGEEQGDAPFPSLEKVQTLIEEAHLAFQRNLRLSICLQRVFLGLRDR